MATVNRPKWRDVVESDGEFDVYRFQSCIFSLVVGGALLAAGISELSSFTIPQTLLGVLGLSQVVYIGGKLVSPPSVAELNTATKALRELERQFMDAAAIGPDPAQPADAQPLPPPGDLATAVRRAGSTRYSAYLDRAKDVRIMFQSITGRPANDANLQPAFVA